MNADQPRWSEVLDISNLGHIQFSPSSIIIPPCKSMPEACCSLAYFTKPLCFKCAIPGSLPAVLVSKRNILPFLSRIMKSI